ncbi:MAG: hypothetical protein ACKOCT_14585 [Alphaproteobacteria bacterium]
MRPDLGDILSAVQRLLQSEVGPAVSDPFVAEQLMYASLLLEYAKKAWPLEHVAVSDEHRDLDATLRAVMPHLAALPGESASRLLREVRSHLGGSAAVAATEPLDAVLARDREGRALLDRAIPLGGPSDDRAGADARGRLREAIDAYLVRSARRQEAAIALLGFAW